MNDCRIHFDMILLVVEKQVGHAMVSYFRHLRDLTPALSIANQSKPKYKTIKNIGSEY